MFSNSQIYRTASNYGLSVPFVRRLANLFTTYYDVEYFCFLFVRGEAFVFRTSARTPYGRYLAYCRYLGSEPMYHTSSEFMSDTFLSRSFAGKGADGFYFDNNYMYINF